MKKLLLFIFTLTVLFSAGAAAEAETLDTDKIRGRQIIGGLAAADTAEGFYLTDSENNILGGPYDVISDYNNYPYAWNEGGDKVLYDSDGTVLASVANEGEILPPANGIYAVMRETVDMSLCTQFELYDYETRTLLHTFDRAIYYYLEQQTEKMVIEKDGKYAFCDKYGNFVTDYIYDEVKKRFNPDYYPFPKAYAIVVENGVEKYIDWDLNEIDLDNYNGEPFVTNCTHISNTFGENYNDVYVLESGQKTALYDLASDTFIIPYQTEYSFMAMNNSFIIVTKDNKEAILDHDGNVLVPLSSMTYSFDDDGKIMYSGDDGSGFSEGIIDPLSGTRRENAPAETAYFHQLFDVADITELKRGVIVYDNERCADISYEDLQTLLNVNWDFRYSRMTAPFSESDKNSYYFKIWNEDKTLSYTMTSGGYIAAGRFGADLGEDSCYVWYCPGPGNAANALHTARQELYTKYAGSTREITEDDLFELPENDMLITDGCSSWAEPEIEQAAAKNLMLWELSDKYTEDITRRDFCRLACRLIATSFYPDSNSMTGIGAAISNIMMDKDLQNAFAETSFSDTNDTEIRFLAAAGIVNGVGDFTFAPDSFITREQAAAILFRTAGFLDKKTTLSENRAGYSDMSAVSDWALEPVSAMYNMGVMHGISENEFSPQGSYTVEQSIATMLRLYETE